MGSAQQRDSSTCRLISNHGKQIPIRDRFVHSINFTVLRSRKYSLSLTELPSGFIQCKGKAIPLQAWTGPLSSRRQSALECGKGVSPTYRPRTVPRKYSWYSFMLEAESTPGP